MADERPGGGSGVTVSLGLKALAGAALLLLLSAAAIGFVSLRVTHAEMRRAYDTRVEFLLETTAQSLAAHLVPIADVEEIDRAMRAPVRTDGVLFCACFGRDGDLLGFRGVPEFDEPLAPQLERLGPAAAGSLHLRTRRGEPVRLLVAPVITRGSADAPLPDGAVGAPDPGGELPEDLEARFLFPREPPARAGGNRTAGTVLIGCSASPVEAEFAPVRRQVWTTVAGVAAAAALLSWLATRLLVRPIHELVAGTQQLAQGAFDHRVEVRSRDEFALLAQSFNAMTEELAQSRDRLARHNQLLEETVEERTHELREAYAGLQVVDKMKDGFLSSISHELRTPITSIRAFAELLHRDPAMELPTRQEFAGIILKESDHLSHLVDDVLDLVTMESGEVSLRLTRLQPADLARAAANQIAKQAAEKEIRVEVAAAPNLPHALWDGAKVARLVLELLDNAVRFSPSGGRVLVTVARAGELVRIEVRDEGPGVPESELEAIFERFHQAGEVLTGKPRGQGLGLAICRVIAQRHGGQVRAAAAARGAQFVVDLPLAPPAREAGTRAASESRRSSAQDLPAPRNVASFAS